MKLASLVASLLSALSGVLATITLIWGTAVVPWAKPELEGQDRDGNRLSTPRSTVVRRWDGNAWLSVRARRRIGDHELSGIASRLSAIGAEDIDRRHVNMTRPVWTMVRDGLAKEGPEWQAAQKGKRGMIIRKSGPGPDEGWPEWTPSSPPRMPIIVYVIGALPFVAWAALLVWLVMSR